MTIKKIIEPQTEYFNYQWGICNRGKAVDINILPVYQYITGNPVKVGIADTGMNIFHSELKNNTDRNLSYDFVHNMPALQSTEEFYMYEHGTSVASIIAMPQKKNKMFGINPNVNVVSLQIMGEKRDNLQAFCEASDALVKAIEYAKKNDIRIINCSFSGKKPSPKEKKAIQDAKDILFVIAAGNEASDLSKEPRYPACYYLDNCIVVAAVNQQGDLYVTSNYGGPTDIGAPGENIVCSFNEGKYVRANATSVAAPFVTGVSSIMLSMNEQLSPVEIKRKITSPKNVTKLDSLKEKVHSGGMLNAYKAIICSEQ